MYCDNCGKPISDNFSYCNYCGAKLKLLVENLSNETVAVALEETIQEKTKINSSNSLKPWIAFAIYTILLTILSIGSSGYLLSFLAFMGLKNQAWNPAGVGISNYFGRYVYTPNYIGYLTYLGLGIMFLMVYKEMKKRKNIKNKA